MKDNTGIDVDIEIIDKKKDLGINFTSNLKFDEHIGLTLNKVNSHIGLLKRNFIHMDKKQFLLLYKGLIKPITDYGNIIYYPVTKKNKQLVENTQRIATRIIPELRVLTYKQRLRALNLPTLDYRRQRGDMIQVFKLIHKIEDFDYEKLFKLSVTNHKI
jgi:hypothetical protein